MTDLRDESRRPRLSQAVPVLPSFVAEPLPAAPLLWRKLGTEIPDSPDSEQPPAPPATPSQPLPGTENLDPEPPPPPPNLEPNLEPGLEPDRTPAPRPTQQSPRASGQMRDVATGISETKTGKSSVIMAAGTLVSRVLGFVRQWMLVVAIGGFGIADAFNTANTLPNTLYNLLAGGILNAVLVPTIVRALSRDRDSADHAGHDHVNALLTFSAIVLLGLTVTTVALAWPLVMLFGGGMQAQIFDLTVIFALWCLPQIFFYGVYALLGQVLNSLSSFGPYMWAPVVNNLVSMLGLGVFIVLYGTAPSENFDVSSWGIAKIALLAGSMTLGIAVQALILIFPLQRLGFQLKPNFTWRGLGLRRVGRVASWAFAALLINAVMNLIVTRVGSQANGAGQADGVFYPSVSVYSYANMLYMLPASLVTISITTALFTAMSYHASRNDFPELSADYLKAVRLSSLFTMILGAMLVVGALPLANLTASNLPPEQAQACATILIVLALGIPGQTLFFTSSRMFYALEDTRTVFVFSLPLLVFTAILALVGMVFLDPGWWLFLTTLGEPLALWNAGIWAIVILRRRGLDPAVPRNFATHYLRCFVAAVLAGLPAWAALHWGFAVPAESWGIGATFASGLWRSLTVGLIMGPLYIFFTWLFNVHEVRDAVARLRSRFVSKG